MLPFISIIVTVINEERYIADLLDSIGYIDYPKSRVETIIVDGGSQSWDWGIDFITLMM